MLDADAVINNSSQKVGGSGPTKTHRIYAPRYGSKCGRACCSNRPIAPDAGPTAANPPHAAAAVDRWDRKTDGQTCRECTVT